VAAAAFVSLTAAAAVAEPELAEPLEVPRGPLPVPDPQLAPEQRVDAAAAELHRRGYADLPVFARALLSRAGERPERAEIAASLAPRDPGVRWEAARLSGDPIHALAALRAIGSSFPALLWLLVWGTAALGGAVLLATVVAVALSFARSLGVHGHALGHVAQPEDPPAWPGVLVACLPLALLPLVGGGPLAIAALAGLLALVRMRPGEALVLGVLMTSAGLLMGPGLERWSAAAVLPAEQPALLAAWRAERAQPLVGDRDRLENALRPEAADPLVRVALATTWKRAGEMERVEQVLEPLAPGAPAPLRERAANLRGIAALSRGDHRQAVQSFEEALALRRSAPVLYNLSQAHGRALRLREQETLFTAARELDHEFMRRHAGPDGTNVHRFLVELPLSAWQWLQHGLRSGPGAMELAEQLRTTMLGRAAPWWAPWALPACAALGLAARRRAIRRCVRCLRVICDACTPGSGGAASCPRCRRRYAYEPRRPRSAQPERTMPVVLTPAMALAALLVPGSAHWIDGRALRGSLQLLLASAALAALAAARVTPAPPEMGSLAAAIPAAAALACAAPAWGWALLEAAGRLRDARSAS
jgi:tetratricopeptide (TPR) repeat protein